ncbi:MAG: hypothetical protein IJE07_07450 [Clostridia bacterium]|nr:hypothetical protein [Clostridia bacterium]
MKRMLAWLFALSLLPTLAAADAPLHLLGVEESATPRGDDPSIRYEQVDFDVWGDPMVWITEKSADVVYLNGRGVDLQEILAQPELLLDLSSSDIIRDHLSRMMPWAQELVTAPDGSIRALPVSGSVRCFSVRRDGWTAAGFTEADIPQSYEELLNFLESWCDRLEQDPEQPARVCDLAYWNTGTASCNHGYWLMELLLTSHALQYHYAGIPLQFDTPEFIEAARRTREVAQRLYRLEPRGSQAEKLPVLFHNALNMGRPGNDDLDYELSYAVPMRLTCDQPPLMLVQTHVLVIPADAAQPEAALRFLENRVQSIPWFSAAELYADFAPGQYQYEGGWPVYIGAGWLAEYHGWDGVYQCATNVFGTNRRGVTGKEKYTLQFLKEEINAEKFARRLDGLVE